MVCRGTHQLRTLSFSKKVAAGRTTSAIWVVGVMNRSTAPMKSSFSNASSHLLGSRPIPARGLQLWIHMPLMG